MNAYHECLLFCGSRMSQVSVNSSRHLIMEGKDKLISRALSFQVTTHYNLSVCRFTVVVA